VARGKFITFEGGEGGGKSTQVKRLIAALENAGIRALATREPGGAPASEDIRELLVSGAVDRWTPMAEVLLNYAAREIHVAKTILPALEQGIWVISDRFSDSTMAYQGYGGGIDRDRISRIHTAVLNDFMPDLTLILDLPVDEGLARAGKRLADAASTEDRFERMGRDFHNRLRDGFLAIANDDPARCRVINASDNEDAVFTAVTQSVGEVIGVSV
jgi:dTMP kinase